MTKARLARGYKFRTEFARDHNIRSVRSLQMLENGESGVGQSILFAVGRALTNWNEDTPQSILEGGPIPPLPGEEADDIAPAPGAPAPATPESWFAALGMHYREIFGNHGPAAAKAWYDAATDHVDSGDDGWFAAAGRRYRETWQREGAEAAEQFHAAAIGTGGNDSHVDDDALDTAG